MTTSSTSRRDRNILSAESRRRHWGGHAIRHSPGGGDVEPSKRHEDLRPTSEEAIPSQPGPRAKQQTGHDDEQLLDSHARLDRGSRAAIPLDVLDPPQSWPSWFSDVTEIQRHSAAVERRFENIPVESVEDGHAALPDEVVEEARRIVHAMLRRWPREYDVYPMDDQRVAVEVDGGFGRRMLLLCEPGGTALCIATVNRLSRRARYEDSSILPDGFIADALKDMGSEAGASPDVGLPSGVRKIHGP